jgi:hypothetical protein
MSEIAECASCGLPLPCKEYAMGPPLDPGRDTRVTKMGEMAKFMVCDLCYNSGADWFFAYGYKEGAELARLICAVGNMVLARLEKVSR